MERVLAIDPGERVGWAHGELHKSVPIAPVRNRMVVCCPTCDPYNPTYEQGPHLKITGQGVTPLKDFALTLFERASAYDTIVYEVWRLYPEMGKKMIGNDMQPSQLVGMIRLIAWLNPEVKLVSQGASIKKMALRSMPSWLHERMKMSTEQHDQDALMHLWQYYFVNYIGKQEQMNSRDTDTGTTPNGDRGSAPRRRKPARSRKKVRSI